MRALLLFLFVAVGCATAPPPKPAALDPASPDAPEAPLPAASTALNHEAVDAGEPEAPVEDHSHHHHGGSR